MRRAESRYPAECAAAGIATGPLVRETPGAPLPSAAAGSPDEEAARLRHALAAAADELRVLARREGGDAAAILEFQIEMLGDPALVESAMASIAAGQSAPQAWWDCMQRHISVYRQAAQAYLRGRAADLEDMREQVTAVLAGGRGDPAWLPDDAILLDDDLTPSRFLALDWSRLGGVALIAGSAASHVAVLARGRGVPMITGIGQEPAMGERAVLDADNGLLILDPSAETLAHYGDRVAARRRADSATREGMHRRAVTADGTPIAVMLNIDDPSGVTDAMLAAADGVGLVRTEAMFPDAALVADEGAQLAAFRTLLARLDDDVSCTFRTLDVGGDKPVPGLSPGAESNPFLGLRGIRLCLERPDLFRPHLRALLRVAVDPRVRLMLPMVTVPAELREARALLAGILETLRSEGVAAAMPPLGIMVETPAAALAVDGFDAAFYSIGSNDLTQYTMAAARDGAGRVAGLNRPGAVAVQRLIAGVVAFGLQSGREVSLCGDLGADAQTLEAVLRTGLRRLSVSPSALGHVKQAIRRLRLDQPG